MKERPRRRLLVHRGRRLVEDAEEEGEKKAVDKKLEGWQKVVEVGRRW